MLNLDFGTDWGTAAVNSFKNRNFLLGTLQEFNGMAEAALDLGIAYLGAALLGALESGFGTTLSTGSLTSGFLDGQNQFQNSVNSFKKSVSNIFSSFRSITPNVYKRCGSINSISLPKNDGQLKHIFREATGHLVDSPNNRQLILDVANNKKNYLGMDKRGNVWYHKINDNGEQIWVRVRNGIIDNAGINTTPRIFNSETGLYKNINR